MVLQNADHGLILDGLVDAVQNEQACHAQVCHSLLQQAEVQAGREEEHLLLLELGSKVVPVGLIAVPAVQLLG